MELIRPNLSGASNPDATPSRPGPRHRGQSAPAATSASSARAVRGERLSDRSSCHLSPFCHASRRLLKKAAEELSALARANLGVAEVTALGSSDIVGL